MALVPITGTKQENGFNSFLYFLILQLIIYFRLRATYGENILKNAVHGSSNSEHAKKTIQAIFGDLKFSEDGILLGIMFYTS
jgi:hypothetical protein